MATPTSPTVSSKSDAQATPNHQTSAVITGAGTTPTPANNVGGGSGVGDEPFLKGNLGHVSVCSLSALRTIYHQIKMKEKPSYFIPATRLTGKKSKQQPKNPQGTIYNFLSLEQQKSPGEQFVKDRYDLNSGYDRPTNESGGVEDYDNGYMAHKPGCPATLPGWEKLKQYGEK